MAGRGGWREEEILPMPKIQASFVQFFLFLPYKGKGGHKPGNNFCCVWALLPTQRKTREAHAKSEHKPHPRCSQTNPIKIRQSAAHPTTELLKSDRDERAYGFCQRKSPTPPPTGEYRSSPHATVKASKLKTIELCPKTGEFLRKGSR